MPAWQTIGPPPGDAAYPRHAGSRWMPTDLRRVYLQDRRRLHWTIRKAINEAAMRAIEGVFAEPSHCYGIGLRELLGVDAASPIIRQLTGKD